MRVVYYNRHALSLDTADSNERCVPIAYTVERQVTPRRLRRRQPTHGARGARHMVVGSTVGGAKAAAASKNKKAADVTQLDEWRRHGKDAVWRRRRSMNVVARRWR
jgi:hypothetical protein